MSGRGKGRMCFARTSSVSDVAESISCGILSTGEKGASRDESSDVGAAMAIDEDAGGVGRGTIRGSSRKRRSSASNRVADTPVILLSATFIPDRDLEFDSGSSPGSTENIEAEDELTSCSVNSIVLAHQVSIRTHMRLLINLMRMAHAMAR